MKERKDKEHEHFVNDDPTKFDPEQTKGLSKRSNKEIQIIEQLTKSCTKFIAFG